MSSAKIMYLIQKANNKRLQIILINEYLNAKKNMNYELWRGLHLLIEKLQGEIKEIDDFLRENRGWGYE